MASAAIVLNALKVTLDILAVASVVCLFVALPLWLHSSVARHGASFMLPWQMWGMAFSWAPATLGLYWLVPRYSDSVKSLVPSPYVRLALTLTCGMGVTLTLMFVSIVTTVWPAP